MKLALDKRKTYAIALEGGGAKGAYEIGAWIALREEGIKYNAVSGTSVGALNGAFMVMDDLEGAVEAWKNIELSQVIELDEDEERDFKKLLNGKADLSDADELLGHFLEIIKNRGLDVAPLRKWINKLVDGEKIRKSPVEFYISTVSLSDFKTLEVKLNELSSEKICDMLLASAYHPTFRHEKLGGKLYTDGGLRDSIPLHSLVSRGYKDIIAIRIPGHGRERRFKMPDDVNLTVIDTSFDLGGVLNFDSRQAKWDMTVGYYDTKRVLYGLSGSHYCIERSLSETEALNFLIDRLYDKNSDMSLRDFCEKELQRISRKLEQEKGDYYQILVALMEREAELLQINPFKFYKDTELMELIHSEERRQGGGIKVLGI